MRQKRRRIPKEVALEDQLSQMTKVEEIDTPIEEATDGEMGTNKLVIGLSNKNVDYRHAFTTEEIFPTRESVLEWVREVGRQHGFSIVILRSDGGGVGRKKLLTLGCERSGKYRPYKDELTRKRAASKKCECPFKLRGRPVKNEGWKVNVICGIHNHESTETIEGHSYANRLSGEEKSLIEDMTKNMVKPKSILLTLKDHNEGNVTTIKQIYNARQAYRASQKCPETEMQQLIKLMERDKYVYWHRKVEASDVVRDIFWTHPDAIKLLNSFSIVLIIDSTYKSKRYGLQLVEVVGVTSTELTFSVAFAFLEADKTDNFIWALEKLRGLTLRNDVMPKVVVTNKDISLMDAVQCVFPSSSNLLCQFHIRKNVKDKCKIVVQPKEEWDPIMGAWDSIVCSPNECEYESRLSKFESVCKQFPIFVDYVKQTWLIPHKGKFVSAWIDKVMHLGNYTIDRVEDAHGRLKKLLQDGRGDLCSCWDALNNMILLQHSEIKMSFQKSVMTWEHRFNIAFYVNLRGFVSGSALAHIGDEYLRVNIVGLDKSICGCTIRSTHGLPCACELARYSMSGNIIPLPAIHSHWKMLSFAGPGMIVSWEECTIQDELEAIQRRFEELDVCEKITLKTKLREIAFPDTTSIYPPVDKDRTPRSLEWTATKRKRSTKPNV